MTRKYYDTNIPKGWYYLDFTCGYYPSAPGPLNIWVDEGCPNAHLWKYEGTATNACGIASVAPSKPSWTCP